MMTQSKVKSLKKKSNVHENTAFIYVRKHII